MPVGTWDDNREIWFFQALVESAKLDSMCENDHRMLIQAGFLWSDSFEYMTGATGAAWPGISGYTNYASMTLQFSQALIQQERRASFSFTLYDGCPWNRLRAGLFVRSTNDANSYVKLYRIAQPGSGARTEIASWDSETVTAPGGCRWLAPLVNITGWTEDTCHTLEVVYYAPIGGIMYCGPAHVEFVSTITGVT